MMETVDEEDWGDLADLMAGSPWRGYWGWSDKAVMELGAAKEVLAAAGIEASKVTSRHRSDPPDCEAIIETQRWGIEVTELVDESLRRESARAFKAGKAPQRWRIWNRTDVIQALQARIDRKDTPEKVKGGPYDRYALIIVSDEFELHRHNVENFLQGAIFHARLITDVILALSYHPAATSTGGQIPTFRLPLRSRP